MLWFVSPVSFNVVDKDAWYYREVSYLAAREITNGTGGGNFSRTQSF
jgi:hypothetical protein